MVIDTIVKLVDVAHYLLTSRTRKAKHPGYVCGVGKNHIKWLAAHAIKKTLLRRQTKYGEVVAWLDREMSRLALKRGIKDMKWAP
ncbi:hypothetical protein F5X68DRAFT_214762 [Plectosphaerella plurivora]|uniref:Uncharacterized protein n=1 Tax=Plectosphaerella plurivora TaxID=936078 RepID=A0A9P8V4S7_9PEZI|nr:hypothetical protein F5X68DRAFT_214762 [Plectosphaerella plurivora]